MIPPQQDAPASSFRFGFFAGLGVVAALAVLLAALFAAGVFVYKLKFTPSPAVLPAPAAAAAGPALPPDPEPTRPVLPLARPNLSTFEVSDLWAKYDREYWAWETWRARNTTALHKPTTNPFFRLPVLQTNSADEERRILEKALTDHTFESTKQSPPR